MWQIFNPALSPDGKWLAQALAGGLTPLVPGWLGAGLSTRANHSDAH
jgi:hypothetical protein